MYYIKGVKKIYSKVEEGGKGKGKGKGFTFTDNGQEKAMHEFKGRFYT